MHFAQSLTQDLLAYPAAINVGGVEQGVTSFISGDVRFHPGGAALRCCLCGIPSTGTPHITKGKTGAYELAGSEILFLHSCQTISGLRLFVGTAIFSFPFF